MQKSPKVFIDHILSCIENIQEYTQGLNKESFLLNRLVQDAVIRNIEVIGEATKNIPQDFRDKYQHIPWKNMSGMRDILIHNYLKVDINAVWTTIEEHLPELKFELGKITDQAKTQD